MRNIFHDILARYLDGEQHAFESSPRELWPTVNEFWNPQVTVVPTSQLARRNSRRQDSRELESQS
jgi:hypothetical protein